MRLLRKRYTGEEAIYFNYLFFFFYNESIESIQSMILRYIKIARGSGFILSPQNYFSVGIEAATAAISSAIDRTWQQNDDATEFQCQDDHNVNTVCVCVCWSIQVLYTCKKRSRFECYTGSSKIEYNMYYIYISYRIGIYINASLSCVAQGTYSTYLEVYRYNVPRRLETRRTS